MMSMSEMMQSMPMDGTTMDMPMMQECVEACSAAAMAATMCADADAGDGMGRCASMCMNTADMASTMMRMLLRPSGMDVAVMRAMMTACVEMATACAGECRMHDTAHCRICASACDAMAEACTRMMAGMTS